MGRNWARGKVGRVGEAPEGKKKRKRQLRLVELQSLLHNNSGGLLSSLIRTSKSRQN